MNFNLRNISEPHLSWSFSILNFASGARILRIRDTLLQVGQRHYDEVIAWKVLNAPRKSLLKGEHPNISSSFARILVKWPGIVTVVGIEWHWANITGWMISYFTLWNIRSFWGKVIDHQPGSFWKRCEISMINGYASVVKNIVRPNIGIWLH